MIEDGIKHGGIGSTISEMFREAGLNIPIHSIGVPLQFFEHGKRSQILEEIGISAQTITRSLVEWNSSLVEVEESNSQTKPVRQLRPDESASQ